MNLSQLLDSAVGSVSSQLFPDLSSTAFHVAERTHNEQRANILLGNLYWQSYLASESLLRDVPSTLISSTFFSAEPLVVFHGTSLFSLLLETPHIGEIEVIKTRPVPEELNEGLFRYLSGQSFPSKLMGTGASTRTIQSRQRVQNVFDLSPRVLRDILDAQPFFITFAPLPTEEQTSLPDPALEVDPQASGYQASTAGCWAQDRAGREGVTAAGHAVPPKGSNVDVGGVSGRVVGLDSAMTDSAFIEVPGGKGMFITTSGPLQKAPRTNDLCSFHGITSGHGQTPIRAFNYEIPAVDIDMQQTVRTDRVTARGDSGAALIDDTGYIIGFAHRRSAPNANPTWSSWIWAGAVFEKHGLSII